LKLFSEFPDSPLVEKKFENTQTTTACVQRYQPTSRVK
jgi:hypothetical protein